MAQSSCIKAQVTKLNLLLSAVGGDAYPRRRQTKSADVVELGKKARCNSRVAERPPLNQNQAVRAGYACPVIGGEHSKHDLDMTQA